MFKDPLSLFLYAAAVLGAQVGIVMMLIGKNNKKTKRWGIWITVAATVVYAIAYLMNIFKE